MPKTVNLKQLSATIQSHPSNGKHRVIAVSGFGGSGKSTATSKLAELLGDAEVIHLDDFIVNQLSQRSEDWDGFDWTRLVDQVLQPIADGADTVEYDVYHWEPNQLIEKRKKTLKRNILLEGVGLIRPELKKYFDLTVWIDVPLETASERGKRRDVEEYHMLHHAALWDTLWTPNDRDYFKKYEPQKNADFLLRV